MNDSIYSELTIIQYHVPFVHRSQYTPTIHLFQTLGVLVPHIHLSLCALVHHLHGALCVCMSTVFHALRVPVL